jgi:hypothetical protein
VVFKWWCAICLAPKHAEGWLARDQDCLVLRHLGKFDDIVLVDISLWSTLLLGIGLREQSLDCSGK